MSWKEKIQKYIDGKKEQIQRGKEVTEQMKAERQRKKLDKLENMKDGTHKRMKQALHNKTGVMDYARNELEIRKQKRKEKYGEK